MSSHLIRVPSIVSNKKYTPVSDKIPKDILIAIPRKGTFLAREIWEKPQNTDLYSEMIEEKYKNLEKQIKQSEYLYILQKLEKKEKIHSCGKRI